MDLNLYIELAFHSFSAGQSLNEETLEWLRTCAAQVEAQLKQKSIGLSTVVYSTDKNTE